MVKRIVLTALILGALLVLLPAISPAGAYLPDGGGDPVIRPTTHPPEKPGLPVTELSDGAQFALWVSFAPEWPALEKHWQELWTVVQWQDPLGDWYDVETDEGTPAWQGNLDYVEDDKAWKVWWVDPPDYGRGPFRWVIYDSPGGEVMVTTYTFYLPHSQNTRVIIEATVP